MSNNEAHPSPSGDQRPSPWYQTAFNEGYLELYQHRDLAEAERAVQMIAGRLDLRPEHRVLDLCCGPGRHMVFLARKARRVVGLDLSEVLLGQARRYWTEYFGAVAQDQGPAMLVRGTMSLLPFAEGSFDRIVNLFTSFGYFEEEAHNRAVLAEVGRLLRPGGQFVIDHINRQSLLATLRPRSERELPDGRRLIETRHWSEQTERVTKDVRCLEPGGGERRWHESVRVYTPGQMETMLREAGLEPVGRMGDYEGAAWREDAGRMIVIARKG